MYKRIIFSIILVSYANIINATDVLVSALVDDIDPATRGGQITYTTSVLNGDNDTATNVSLVFPIPATTSFVSVNNGACVHDGGSPGQVNCLLGDMIGDGFGGPITTIDFIIQTGVLTGATVDVSATITADGDNDTTQIPGNNNYETQNTTIDNGADLSLTINGSPDPAVAGGTVTYTIVATNNGPNDAGAVLNPNGVTLVNTLPAGVSYSSFTGIGWSCGAVGQDVTCTRETISNAASAPNLNIVGNIVGQIAGTITDTVTISSITADPIVANNTMTEDVVIGIGADLTMTKTVASPVIGNVNTTFTLMPRNLGPYDAATVTVTDTLPANFTYVSFVSATGWTCGNVLQDITCTRASYAVGSTDNIVIETNVPASGLNITNTAIIAAATNDPDNSNNTDGVTFSVVPDGADLTLSKTKTPDPVAQGADMTSSITVTNLGPQDTTGVVTVVDVLDAGETYVSGSDANWNCNLVGGSPGGTVTCTYQGGVLVATASAPVLSIITTAINAGVLANTATVTDAGGTADAVGGNNSSTASVTSTALIADLGIAKIISDSTLTSSPIENSSTYTLTVTNFGPNDIVDPGVGVEGVVISDALPAVVNGVVSAIPSDTGINYLATVNSNLGASFSCSGSATVVCTLDDGETFANGDFVNIDITVTRPMRDGTFTNTATVTSEVLGDDDNTGGNNSSNTDITIEPLVDVEVLAPSIPVNPAKAGTEATIVLQFRNNGPSTAQNVAVTHVFSPPGGRNYTFISAVPTEGSCSFDTPSDTLTCTGMTLGRNENRQVTMVVRPGWEGTNSSWTLAGNTTITTTSDEQDVGVNTLPANLDVVQADLDLLIENNDVTDPVGWAALPGAFPATLDNIIVYKVDITNRGPSLATNVELTYAMTPKAGKDVTFLCDGNNATSCNIGTSLCDNLAATISGPATLTMTCDVPDNSGNPLLNNQELAPGTMTSRYLFFRAESAPDSVGDTHDTLATISSNEIDNLAGNNNEAESTSVRAKVDLAVTKTAPAPVVGLKEPFDFTITVNNNGPGDSAGSMLADNLPAGMTLTGAPIPSQGSCTGVNGDNSFTCNLQTINNGANATVTVPVEIIVLGGITNTASVISFGVDINNTNDNESETVTVVKSSIAGTVYNDLNDNGNQEVGDSGIAGVQVTLTGTAVSGDVINIVTNTDVNGNYLFDNLSASDVTGYTLTETQPLGFTDGLDSIGGVVIAGSRNTDAIANIVVGINDTLTDYDFADLGRGGISGFVWIDEDNNAVKDATESGVISGVQITLSGTETVSGSAVNLMTTTDAYGRYQFIDLRAGVYVIDEVQPGAWLDGQESLGTGGGNVAADQFTNIVLATNSDSFTDYNFGELGASLSGVVYQDNNQNGIDDAEPKIAQVVVTLSGIDIDGNIIDISVLTNSVGVYQFTNLPAVNGVGYTISETQPVKYTDGIDTLGSLGGNAANDEFSAIPVTAGSVGRDYNFGEGVLLNSSIAGFVYIDSNQDGINNNAESGIPNVELRLTGKTLDGYAVSRQVVTAADGSYLFEKLGPSDSNGYQIFEVQPVLFLDGLESIVSVIQANSDQSDLISNIELAVNQDLVKYNFGEYLSSAISGQVFIDFNDDGLLSQNDVGIEGVSIQLSGNDESGNDVQLSTITDASGFYRFDNLSPSNDSGYLITEQHPVDYLDGADSINGVVIANSRQSDVIQLSKLEAQQEQANNRFGEVIGITLSGRVWADSNDNGQIDDNEIVRISGVIVNLIGVDSFDNVVEQQTVTDENGYYEFIRVPRGNYRIIETQPSAWLDGKEFLGSLGGIQGNDQFDNVSVINLVDGLDYNFGEQGSSIEGLVYNDLDDDGNVDANETGIPEVVVQITGTDINSQPVSRTLLTGEDGRYQFVSLPIPDPQGFTITEQQPEDSDDGKDSVGSLGGTLANDSISQIGFTTHTVNGIDYNFGEILLNPASISGLVWLDSNHNREEDDNSGQANWVVELLLHGDDPESQLNSPVIATVISDANGNYIFEGLSPGLYEVRFRHPQGGVLYGTPVSDHAGADTSRGTIRNLQLLRGEHIVDQNLPIDPTGIVYDSQTREPVAGATVRIAGPAGFDPAQHLLGGIANVEQITAADGFYQFLLFNSAPTGSYILEITEATGYLPGVAPSMPACNSSLVVDAEPTPALVHISDQPPVITSDFHSPDSCPSNITGLAASNDSTQFYLSFDIFPLLPSANVVNNHIPLDPYHAELISVNKTSTVKNVSLGDFVPYQITVTNGNNFPLSGLTVIDQLPPGFKYINLSSKIDGIATEPSAEGRILTWNDIDIATGQTIIIDLITVVGAGVQEGEYVNQAWIVSPDIDVGDDLDTNVVVSNTGLATIRVVPDPIMDCSDLIGKVFDDKNVNGIQDENERGIAAVRLATARGLLVTTDKNGRYHIACAAIPNELRGSNFIMKVDERTLPSGYRVTTENPRVVRLTRGKLAKINFGATIHKVMRIEVNDSAFSSYDLSAEYKKQLEDAVSILKQKPSVVRIAYQQQTEDEQLIEDRINKIKITIEAIWQQCDCNYPLIIEESVFRSKKLPEVSVSQWRADHE